MYEEIDGGGHGVAGNSPIRQPKPTVPIDGDGHPMAAGFLYRHVDRFTVWRCEHVGPNDVWLRTVFHAHGPAQPFMAERFEKDRMGLFRLNSRRTSVLHRTDAAELGRVFMEFYTFLRTECASPSEDERGDRDAPQE